jgi:hypothetical protein
MAKPKLTVAQILAWADAHQAQTGDWPKVRSGSVAGAPGETWQALDGALKHGHRGLPGGDSLARLLLRTRGVRERRGGSRGGSEAAGARRRLAVQLRRQGLSLRQIGKRLGVTGQAVAYLLRRDKQEG